MKKKQKTALKYYMLLLSGFIIFMPLVVFDYFFPGSVDTHGGLVIFWLIISFIGYLYSIFRFVKTKEFAEYEKNSKEREKEFYKDYKAHLWKI